MEHTKKEIISYIDNLTLLVMGIVLLSFPLVFSTSTTDAFSLPKQLLVGAGVLISLVLFGVKMIFESRVKLRTTPFDLPLLLFTVVTFVSAYLSINRFDGFIAFVPLLFVIIAYFVIINIAKTENAILFLVSSLVLGAVISGLISVLAFFKIYILPFSYTHLQTFSVLGSLLDQAIYLALVLPVAGYIGWPLLSPLFNHEETKTSSEEAVDLGDNSSIKMFVFAVAFVLMAVSLAYTVYMLISVQKPLILPFETGFQTAFAAISQDVGRVFVSFLFGSGFGTYVTDFTRFKHPTYNLNQDLWSFTFFRSSSFILELLATTGFLGLISFLFIIYRVLKQKTFFLPIILAIVASLLLPFSPTLTTLFFIVLSLFAALLAVHHPRRFPDLEFHFVAFRRGLVNIDSEQSHQQEASGGYAALLPVIFFLVLLGVVCSLGFFSVQYVRSDITFQQSLVAASQNNGIQTYNLERQAITIFPYRDAYYRIFAQTNLALANSLAAAQPRNQKPNQQAQQDIINLIQQSINAGRTAVTISPQSSIDWDNLSSIYRALIGFGQNADQFAIITNQQAINLDPNNPQEYINLGGIWYQLGSWDNASRQFITASQLKPDYANAYYNLGHSFEAKSDYANALTQYQIVKSLVINDTNNRKKIDAEILALQAKIGNQAKAPSVNKQPATNQPPLDVNKPSTQLPERKPPVQIPGPTTSPIPSPSSSPAPSQGQ